MQQSLLSLNVGFPVYVISVKDQGERIPHQHIMRYKMKMIYEDWLDEQDMNEVMIEIETIVDWNELIESMGNDNIRCIASQLYCSPVV